MKNTLYFIELDEFDNFIEYVKYIDFLSPEKQIQIYNFKFDIDKKLSLISDLFVQYIMCKILGLNIVDLFFKKNVYGKPYLVGFPYANYNISHTRNAIVIGLSENPIGVDIEKIKTIDLKIAEKFFNKNELNYIFSNNKEQDKLFYEIWTKKEAYIKWIGKGFSIPLDAFDITDIEIKNKLSTTKINDYIISVCSTRNSNNVDIIKLKENQVSQFLANFLNQ